MHVAELDPVSQSGHLDRAGRIGDLAALVQKRQHPLAGRNALIDIRESVRERAQRTRNLREHRQIGDKPAGVELAAQHEAAAVNQKHGRR